MYCIHRSFDRIIILNAHLNVLLFLFLLFLLFLRSWWTHEITVCLVILWAWLHLLDSKALRFFSVLDKPDECLLEVKAFKVLFIPVELLSHCESFQLHFFQLRFDFGEILELHEVDFQPRLLNDQFKSCP